MLYRIMVGAMALSMRASALWLMADDLCMAAGAVALGEPADIAKDGIAIFTQVNAANAKIAKERALAGCKALPNSSNTSKAGPAKWDAGFRLGDGAQLQGRARTGTIQLPRYGRSHASRRVCRGTERPLVRRLRQVDAASQI
jgi:hypothetical protein